MCVHGTAMSSPTAELDPRPGLRLTELRADAVTVHPDSRTLTGAAEPSFTSTVQSAGGCSPTVRS
jgi:hypothetical protein